MSGLIPYQCTGCGSTVISAAYPLYVQELKHRGMSDDDMYFNPRLPASTKRKDLLFELQVKLPCCRLHMLTHPTGLQGEYVKEGK